MATMVRLLYALLGDGIMKTDEAKTGWLAGFVRNMPDGNAAIVYGMCAACAYIGRENKAYEELEIGHTANYKDSILRAIDVSMRSGADGGLRCAKCKDGIDITDEIIQNYRNGKIFCAMCKKR